MDILLIAAGGLLTTYLTDLTKRWGKDWAYLVLFILVGLAAWGYSWLKETSFDWNYAKNILLLAVAWYEIVTKRIVPKFNK